MCTRTTPSFLRGLRDLALFYVVGISLLVLLSGCAAVHTSIAKGNLVGKPWISGTTLELQPHE